MGRVVNLFIHIAEETDDYLSTVLGQMRMFIDICAANRSFVREEWYISSDNYDTFLIYKYDHQTRSQWEQGAKKHEKEATMVLGHVVYTTKSPKTQKATFSMSLRRSIKFTNPDIGKERSIQMSIPYSVWLKIDSQKVLSAFQRFCSAIKATWACIDWGEYCPNSVYDGNFRLYAADLIDVDPETRLPDICWAQYISKEMIDQIPSLSWENLVPPSEIVQFVEWQGECGIWIQLSKSIIEADINKRIHLRRYFNDALYPISTEKVAKQLLTPYGLIGSEMFPLYAEELEEIKGMVQAWREE